MKTLVTALTLGTLIAAPVKIVPSANARDLSREQIIRECMDSGTPQREQLGQFCAPPGENEVPRLYCRDWHGDGDIAGRGLRTPT